MGREVSLIPIFDSFVALIEGGGSIIESSLSLPVETICSRRLLPAALLRTRSRRTPIPMVNWGSASSTSLTPLLLLLLLLLQQLRLRGFMSSSRLGPSPILTQRSRVMHVNHHHPHPQLLPPPVCFLYPRTSSTWMIRASSSRTDCSRFLR